MREVRRPTRVILPAAAMVVALSLLAGCTGSNVRNGARALGEFAAEIGGAVRGGSDELSAAAVRTQVDDLVADAAVVAARNAERDALRSTPEGDDAYRTICNVTVDFVYPSVDDPTAPSSDEITAAAEKLAEAAYGASPGSATETWANRIQELGDLAFGEPDQQQVAALKLARDAAVYGFQRAYCG